MHLSPATSFTQPPAQPPTPQLLPPLPSRSCVSTWMKRRSLSPHPLVAASAPWATRQSYADHFKRMGSVSMVTSASLHTESRTCAASLGTPSTRQSCAGRTTPEGSVLTAHVVTSYTTSRRPGRVRIPPLSRQRARRNEPCPSQHQAVRTQVSRRQMTINVDTGFHTKFGQ